MKRVIISLIFIFVPLTFILAQSSVDALRYSRTNPGGTARFMALGGAFGALGADFTTASTNPAGLGVYKTSELTFTPSVFIGSTESFYNGMTGSDQRSNFNLGDVGLVMTKKLATKGKESGWKNVQFATGLNRLADYNNRIMITGPNPYNSFLDTYVEYADGTNFLDIEDDTYGEYAFDLNPAWWTYLLDLKYADVDNIYTSPVPNGGALQSKSIESKGSMNEYVISMAANYEDRLYIGGTIGIPFIRYYETSVYTETDHKDTINDFKSFNIIEDLETRGNGFNFKFGVIYRAADWIRIGASVHTPTWFTNMRDYWRVTMQSYFDNGDRYTETSPEGNYHYDLTTPFRFQVSAGFIIGNIGLVTTEYEFADFSSARFSAPDYNFSSENSSIRNSYTTGHTVRLGTEWRYKIFSFRAGGNYLTSPFKNNINDGSRIGFSGGIGIRSDWFFADVAYAYTKMIEDYYLYSTETVFTNPAENTLKTHRILLTLGVKF